MEAAKQHIFERAGFAVVHVDELPGIRTRAGRIPKGSSGDTLVSLADGVVVPATG